jgi:phospholipid transport system substrate-binding protein
MPVDQAGTVGARKTGVFCKTRRVTTLVLLLFLAAWARAGAAVRSTRPPQRTPVARPSEGPLARLEAADHQIHRLMARKYPSWSPEREVQQLGVRQTLDALFDYEELALRALGSRWSVLTLSQRTTFVDLLRQLSESAALHRFTDIGDQDLRFLSQAGKGREVEVQAVRTGPDGRHEQVFFRMVRTPDRWSVYDVIIGGVSLVDSYRDEFARIIARESFDGLLDRMRERLREQREGPGI